MKKILAVILFITLFCQSGFCVSDLYQKKVKIITTTSDISTIINSISQNKIDVETLISPTTCPGNYDIDTKTIEFVNDTNIFFYHSWQQTWAKELKSKIFNLGIIYRVLQTDGNLMIPYVNIRAAQEIKDLLVVWDSDNKDFYEANFVKYVYKLKFIEEKISKINSRYHKKVACNNKIADFLEWLGFDVVVKYKKQELLSVKDMKYIAQKIKDNNVKIVVDNLQSGTQVGRTLAKELKLKHVIISNFPLGNSYISTLEDNLKKIDQALK